MTVVMTTMVVTNTTVTIAHDDGGSNDGSVNDDGHDNGDINNCDNNIDSDDNGCDDNDDYSDDLDVN